MTLEQAKKNPLGCEEFQLKNWLSQLDEYLKRDTEMKVVKQSLSGQRVCPACGKLMAINAKEFCDKCGQKIVLNNDFNNGLEETKMDILQEKM